MRFRFLLAAILSGIGLPLSAQETVQVYDFTDGNYYYKIVSGNQVELSPISYTIESPGAEPVYQGYDGYDNSFMPSRNVMNPDTWEWYELVGIGAHAFEGAERFAVIEGLVFSGSGITYIGDCAFKNCKNLTRIEIPDEVLTIGESAFESCTSLKYVKFGDDPVMQSMYGSLTVGSNAFNDTPSLSDVFFVDRGFHVNALQNPEGLTTFQLCGSEESPTRFYSNYPWAYNSNFGIECVSYCKLTSAELVYTGDFQQAPVPEISSFELMTHTGAQVILMTPENIDGPQVNANQYGIGYSARVSVTFQIPSVFPFQVTVPIDYEWRINPAPLSLIVEDVTREYGEPNPEFTFRFEGFVGGDDESVLPNKPGIWYGWEENFPNESSPVGEYTVYGYIPLEGTNYTLWGGAYGFLTITPAPLTVSAKASRRYGEENPEIEFVYEGFRNGDTPEVITELPETFIMVDADSPVGDYPIIVSGGRADNYRFIYENGTFTVEKADQTIEWDQDLSGIGVGDEIDLAASSSSSLPVEYVSSDPSVAEINGNRLHVHAEGSVTITAVQSGNDNYNEALPVEKEISIAGRAVESISLNLTEGKLKVGDTMQLEVSVMPEDAAAGSLVWESSDPGVATVTESGVVTGISSGDVVITVYPADYPEVRASCSLKVDVASGVEAVASGDLRIIATDGRILISGIDGTLEVTVYNVSGHAVYKGKDCEISLPHGTYIVSAAGNTVKVVL